MTDDYICTDCFARVPLEASQQHADWHAWLYRAIEQLRERTFGGKA